MHSCRVGALRSGTIGPSIVGTCTAVTAAGAAGLHNALQRERCALAPPTFLPTFLALACAPSSARGLVACGCREGAGLLREGSGADEMQGCMGKGEVQAGCRQGAKMAALTGDAMEIAYYGGCIKGDREHNERGDKRVNEQGMVMQRRLHQR
eukprot:1160452-Pelagomonas_calceolata.AAC.4